MRNSTSDAHSVAPLATQDSRSTNPDRRRFLLTLGVSGAGAAVAVASSLPGAVAAQTAVAPSADTNDSTYRETEHVRDYYRTAKI